ncbi:MAG: LicD family protein [Prevotella sp.]|nr:LicD family protein [Prevotella sp.]
MKKPEFDQEALRQRFNPDGSLLRRQQMRMLEILLEVDRICKKHGIQYWLSSGTLIGAARHKGFIPWDDDLDIEMLWPDYRRLMRVLPEELPSTMALQTTKTDPNYFFFYAKVRDRRSHLEESNRYDRVWREQGIYIDIFPFYRQPLWIHMLSEKAQGHVYKIMNRSLIPGLPSPVGRGDMWKVRFITRFNEKIFFPILRFLCRFSKARETYGLGIPYHDPRYMEDILPLTEMEFEGHLFPVPRDTHAALTLKYGDYMTLPDIEKINLHVGKLTIED